MLVGATVLLFGISQILFKFNFGTKTRIFGINLASLEGLISYDKLCIISGTIALIGGVMIVVIGLLI